MYRSLKQIAKGIIPTKLLLDHEEKLRWPLALWYRGTQQACNICGQALSSFIVLDRGDRLCPACGSLDRNRRLWFLLTQNEMLAGRILHFSPSRTLYRRLSVRPGIEYVSTDFENEFIADQHYDITRMEVEDATFDLIICYHVLEHIEADLQAMRELYRVCKPGGQVWIQTPFREGGIYEDRNIINPADRLQHFGQADHVRVYSVDGLKKRLQKAGFLVEVQHFSADSPQQAYHGFKAEEFVLFAKK